jgi:cell division protein ZapA
LVGQVSVTINGKRYRMACDDGEESHLTGLAERLSVAIEALRKSFGEIGDQRLTVMAALTFADQAAEAERRIARLEQMLAESEEARAAEADRGQADSARAASALAEVAERIEGLAGRVGGGEGASNGRASRA